MNDALHRIRLPKPWSVITTQGTDPQASDVSITTHEFQRNFQRPSGLTDHSRVELEIQLDDSESLQRCECLLNADPLDAQAVDARRWRVPIECDRLQSINRLTIRLVWLGQRQEAVLPQVAILIG